LNYNIIFKPKAQSFMASVSDCLKDLWLPQIYASHLMHFNLLSCQSIREYTHTFTYLELLFQMNEFIPYTII